MLQEKAADILHELTVLQGQKQQTSYNVPAQVANEDIAEALKGRYGDQQLAVADRAQLKSQDPPDRPVTA